MRRGGLLGLAAAGAGVAAAGVGAGLALRRPAAGAADPLHWLDPLPGAERTVRAGDGAPLFTVRSGDAQAPVTVVFVHGYCCDLRMWHPQWPALGGRAGLVAYDQRSHGRSGRVAPPRAVLSALADDLRAVLDAEVPTGPVVLVGHSMGGMTVLALAADHPDLFSGRVAGVGLLSTSAGRAAPAAGLAAAGGTLTRWVLPRAVPPLRRAGGLVDRSRAASPAVVRAVLRSFSFRSSVPASALGLVADMIGRTPFEVMVGFLPAFVKLDLSRALPALAGVPALVLVGAGDLLTPPEHSRLLAGALPGADLVVVPDAGHMVTLEHPEVVRDALLALLDRVGAGR